MGGQRKRRVAMVFAALAIATLSSSCGRGATESVASEPGAVTKPPASVEEPALIGDGEGVVRGEYSPADDLERIDLITHLLMVDRILGDAPTKEDRRAMIDALMVVHAIPVTEKGEVVGYFTDQWVSAEDYPSLKARAERTVDELRKDR